MILPYFPNYQNMSEIPNHFFSPRPELLSNDDKLKTHDPKPLPDSKALAPACPDHYTTSIESKVWRVVKTIFYVLFFPLGLKELIHRGLGKIFIDASDPRVLDRQFNRVEKRLQTQGFTVKKIQIKVDGISLDATIVVKLKNPKQKRWTLFSLGMGESVENYLECSNAPNLLEKMKSRGIFFNYPGIGHSSGPKSRNAALKAHEAILRFLEDKEKGLDANEIICYGHSLGGGMQGESLAKHQFKDTISYRAIYDRTFSELAIATPETLGLGKVLGFIAKGLIKLFGWNLRSYSKKALNVPVLVLQTASVRQPEFLTDTDKLKNDGVISKNGSLANAIFQKGLKAKVLGIDHDHADSLDQQTIELIAEATEN